MYHYKSIPSGNTATIFTLTGILFYYVNSQYGKVGLLTFAILVELSRIAVGVHWPADILASAAIGYLAAIGGHYFVVLFKWKENKVVQLIVGFILLVAAFYLLLFYDSRYEQAFLLQHIIAISILILGIKEYYLILRG